MTPTSMMRANEWASGRNSSVEAPGISKSAASGPWTALRAAASRFLWVISHPFGLPVVPEV
jgi:hypothetical protein